MRFQSTDLSQMRPVAVAHQQLGHPKPPLFDATTVLVDLRRLGRFRFPLPDGGDVLQQGGLVALHGKEVAPPWATTR